MPQKNLFVIVLTVEQQCRQHVFIYSLVFFSIFSFISCKINEMENAKRD